MGMIDELQRLKSQALHELVKAVDQKALASWHVDYLGRQGRLSAMLKRISRLPLSEKPAAGRIGNSVKHELEQHYHARHGAVGTRSKSDVVTDITWPGEAIRSGHLHPITLFLRRIRGIFISMGFDVVEGPEIELAKYNFDLLNIPADHPARDRWDTFFVRRHTSARSAEGSLVLRTHTSPMQIRVMEQRTPPVRLIVPGRVFRHEATDASHEATFYQCEGLVIDRGIRVTDLIGTLRSFLLSLFGSDVKTRVRPEYYPFVEPGMDIDMSCLLCGGEGCSACKQTGWMEMLGSGMVHSTVLKNMRVDPKKYSGFAFGLGVDRLMMLYYGINDVRLVHSGDMRFLEQF